MTCSQLELLQSRIDSLEKENRLLQQTIKDVRGQAMCPTQIRGAILELSPEELKMILCLPDCAKIDGILVTCKGGNSNKDIEKLRIRALNIGPWLRETEILTAFLPEIHPAFDFYVECRSKNFSVEWPGCPMNP